MHNAEHSRLVPIKTRALVERIMQPDSNVFLPEYGVAIQQVAERYAYKEELMASAKKRSQ